MKKILIVVGGIVASLTGVACSSGGGGGTGLSSGTYNRVSSQASPATCDSITDYYANVASLGLTVTATDVTVDFGGGSTYTYAITGTTIHDNTSSGTQSADFSDPAIAVTNFGFSRTYTCAITLTSDFPGTILGHNKVEFDDDYQYSSTGADCAAVVTSANIAAGGSFFPTTMPCETKVTGIYAK